MCSALDTHTHGKDSECQACYTSSERRRRRAGAGTCEGRRPNQPTADPHALVPCGEERTAIPFRVRLLLSGETSYREDMGGTPRACAFCRRPMPLTTRQDALYCSTACRSRAGRLRRGRLAVPPDQTCPVCGQATDPVGDRRKDALYDRAACRAYAHYLRRRQAEKNGSPTG
ncbi:hypothetical protein GCM10009731_04710 [Streptomyces globosus]